MKYSKIGALIKKAKKMEWTEINGEQWIGTDQALYCLEGMPKCKNTEQMLRILGIPEEKIVEIVCSLVGEDHRRDVEENLFQADQPMGRSRVLCHWGEDTIGFFFRKRGITIIAMELLVPVSKMMPDMLCVSQADGGSPVVAKKGLMPVAIIWPYVDWTDEQGIDIAIRMVEGAREWELMDYGLRRAADAQRTEEQMEIPCDTEPLEDEEKEEEQDDVAEM